MSDEKPETRNVSPVKAGEKASSSRGENLESEYLAAGFSLAYPAIAGWREELHRNYEDGYRCFGIRQDEPEDETSRFAWRSRKRRSAPGGSPAKPGTEALQKAHLRLRRYSWRYRGRGQRLPQ